MPKTRKRLPRLAAGAVASVCSGKSMAGRKPNLTVGILARAWGPAGLISRDPLWRGRQAGRRVTAGCATLSPLQVARVWGMRASWLPCYTRVTSYARLHFALERVSKAISEDSPSTPRHSIGGFQEVIRKRILIASS